ncbi:HAD hydrolase family protein [Gottfriedia acidiceleris]
MKLLRAYRINPNEVVAIGDGPNDIEMLRQVGCGYRERYR